MLHDEGYGGFAPGSHPSARAVAMRHAVLPSERQVIDLVLEHAEAAIEWTAQEVAERAGVGRTTVMRACQTLGYRGYPQLRVALAAELGASQSPQRGGGAAGLAAEAEAGARAGVRAGAAPVAGSALSEISADVAEAALALGSSTGMLDERSVELAVSAIAGAQRVLVVANGLSAVVASALSMRLTAHGRHAEFIADSLAQQIAARHLSGGDACIVVSGSGANDTSLGAAAAAAAAGASVIAITSFRASALTDAASLSLVIAPSGVTFRSELEHASRVSLMLFAEALVRAVSRATGDPARSARAHTLEVISEHLEEQ